MIALETVLILAQKELRDARRNRWFVLYTAAFAGLSLGLAWLALAGAGSYGLAGFGRTSASLINLILLIVPLQGLTLGALCLAGEREKGTLLYLLAQPITQAELLLGKFLGLALALLGSLALGFGLTGLLIAFYGGAAQAGAYLSLLGLGALLAVASLSIGVLISAATRRAATAVGIALFIWLLLAFFGDIGLLGGAVVLRPAISQLLAVTLVNPLQVFKIAAILALDSSLEVLGPAGVYAVRTYGGGLFPLLITLLLGWIAAPYAAAAMLFHKRGLL